MSNDDHDEKSGQPPQPTPPAGSGMSMSFGIPREEGDTEASMRMEATPLEIQPLPFRIMVLDQFCGDATPPERAQRVTAATIDDVMSSLGVRATIAVPNHLASKPAELIVDLRFASMRDFRPKLLLAQTPELRAVNALHERLGDLRAGRISQAQLEAELEPVQGLDALAPALNLLLQGPTFSSSADSAAPATPASDPGATEGRKLLDELLDISTPSTPTKPTPAPGPTRSALDNVIGSITGGGGPKTPPAQKQAIAQATELVGKLLAAQLQEILHAPAVRAIERAWRGLHLLASQATGSDGQPVRIEILHATTADFATVYAERVHGPECAGDSEHALSLAVLGCAVHNNAAQIQALRDVQQQAEDLQAPTLWSMEPMFLGASAQELSGRDSVRSVLGSSSLAKWRGLRGEDSARWSGACFNRWLLRNPHSGEIGQWSFAERSDEYLWGSPSYLVAGVIARSVIDTGWPTRFTGLAAGGIGGRPLADLKPVEAQLGEAAVEDLADGGIMALTSIRGRDEVVLLRAPSAHEAAQFGNRDQANSDSRKMSSLPFQLLASHIAATTLRHKAALVADGDLDAMRRRFETFLKALVGDTGAGATATVTVEPDPKDRDTTWVHCSVRTGSHVLGGAEVQFSLPA